MIWYQQLISEVSISLFQWFRIDENSIRIESNRIEIIKKSNRTESLRGVVACLLSDHVAWDSSCRIRIDEKKKTKKKRAKRTRLYIVDDSKKNRSMIIIEQNIDETQRFISSSWTLIETKKRTMKRASISSTKKMTSRIVTMTISMRLFSNLVRNAIEAEFWAKSEVMKLINRKRVMIKRDVSRSRFVSKSMKTSSNINFVINDFDSNIWEKSSSSLSYSTMFATIEWVLWFYCWLTQIRKITTLLLYKSSDEISSHRLRWAHINVNFTYYKNRATIRKYAFTWTTNWTRKIERSNTRQRTSALWRYVFASKTSWKQFEYIMYTTHSRLRINSETASWSCRLRIVISSSSRRIIRYC
jgi:hypothetical protein